MVQGVHFTEPSADVGWTAVARNVSDIAAMGGRPRAAVVALALDARVKVAWLEAFYRGMADAARRFGVTIVGGDVAQHPGGIVGTLTLIGEATAPRVLTRTGARTGDWIYVTGRLGGSLPTGHHWRFTPRLAEGAWLAGRSEVRAMMDLSDGLAKDVHDLTPKGAEPAIESGAVPIRRGCDLRAALSDGEDYELLFAVQARADRAALERAWQRRFATPLTCIGRFVRRGRRPASALNLESFHGFEHLR
jgi:thiamine-monophosphate kinase